MSTGSMVSAGSAAISAFYLFKGPTVVAPHYELWRRIGNVIAKQVYINFHEPGFTEEGFQRGIRKGIFACANALYKENYERLNCLLTKDAARYVKRRIVQVPPEMVKEKLSFNEDNIVLTFTNSFVFSSDRFLGFDDRYRPSFYATAVGFIDKNSTEPITLKQASKRIDDLLVCNITFARIIQPIGNWHISDLNFFDGKVIRYV